jgi:hypothetical protein
MTHQGCAKKVIVRQQEAHNVCGMSTMAQQAKQRGGSTPSTIARPTRRTALAKRIVEADIGIHHPL